MSKIYVCPTPLGNLDDMTFRVIGILKKVDFIAAEDTRHSIKLLNHFKINTNMISYHEHNEQSRSKEIISRVKNGEDCALISDAGMPGISDPGEILIKKALGEDIEVEVLSGGSAFLLALVASGFDTERFVFEGFLPRKSGEKSDKLKRIEKTMQDKAKKFSTLLRNFKEETQNELTNAVQSKISSTKQDLAKKLKESVMKNAGVK